MEGDGVALSLSTLVGDHTGSSHKTTIRGEGHLATPRIKGFPRIISLMREISVNQWSPKEVSWVEDPCLQDVD